jgi:Zn-dependent protease
VNQLTSLIVMLALFVPSITFHEFMHAWVAYRMGDPTAKLAGRVTMNPIRSIDPFGSVLLPLIGYLGFGTMFGYAKPVPYDPRYFKNLRLGEVLVGLAGPSANLLLAFVGAGLARSAGLVVGTSDSMAAALFLIGSDLAMINLVLMFFNLIPIPPLDGSSIVPIFLKDDQLRAWYGMQQYAFGLLIVLIFGLPFIADLLGLPGLNPLGWYLRHTALPVLRFLIPGLG